MSVDPFGPESHDQHAPDHSKVSAHYCMDFDGLWICEDCTEFHTCTCVEKTQEQKARAEKYHAEHLVVNEANKDFI